MKMSVVLKFSKFNPLNTKAPYIVFQMFWKINSIFKSFILKLFTRNYFYIN